MAQSNQNQSIRTEIIPIQGRITASSCVITAANLGLAEGTMIFPGGIRIEFSSTHADSVSAMLADSQQWNQVLASLTMSQFGPQSPPVFVAAGVKGVLNFNNPNPRQFLRVTNPARWNIATLSCIDADSVITFSGMIRVAKQGSTVRTVG